ncbi:MAG TPA: EAL domain-containing protein [Mobilitalea sp.]|nr:EAL domain-containing protein [Mobilitalea sp.]
MVRYKLFNKLLEENLFHYHFQPIVNTRTGEIIAYEALMRTDDEISMSPTEILEFATRENRLYEIEKLTFFNVLKLMSENHDTFKTNKLFINSISSNPLKDEDFEELFKTYGSLFDNIVLEITEATLIDKAGIKSLQERMLYSNCQLALDDYGTGFSNESILLNTSPNYIKIDRMFLQNINIDSKKQHLVSNLINFAHKNNIKAIAEGVENYEEFVYAITLGVDYIQGFYTGRPNPLLPQVTPEECIDTIFALNQENYLETISRRVYETTKEDNSLSMVALALEQYTELLINVKEIILQGSHDIATNIKINIADNQKCCITLDQVNLQGTEALITLGHNCSVTLKLVSNNNLNNGGIRVPESSDLTITGDGNMIIKTEMRNGVGIGGGYEHSYGNITLAGTGTIKVSNKGEMSIGIGGAHNTTNSVICLDSGNIQVDTSGYEAVGIGNVSGNAIIKIGDCRLQTNTLATKTVAIGCMGGTVKLKSSGVLDVTCEGNKAVVLGSLDNGAGSITILGGRVQLHYNSHIGAGIGAIGGNIDITIQSGDISIYSEGMYITGIGDATGTGNILISNGIISTTLYSAHPLPIGNTSKKVVIDGGNIQCIFPEDYTIVNSYETPLEQRIITLPHAYRRYIGSGNSSYEYLAEHSSRYTDIKVYLPMEII